MKYRLVALDVDGTLLNDRYELTPPTKRTVKEVFHAGVEIVLCTGRSPTSVFPILRELEIEGTIITHNGAATVESRSRRVSHQFPILPRDFRPFVEYCRQKGVHFDVNTAFDLYIEKWEETERELYEKFWMTPVLVEDVMKLAEPVVKLSLFASQRIMDEVEEELRSVNTSLRLIRSGETFIDVLHSKATKGNALRHYAESKGIPREQIIAIGNYFNDLDMIRYAGLGIAMGNSPDEVKNAADAVTCSNNDHGVHEALRAFVFSS